MIERATQCLHRVGKNAIGSYDQGRRTGASLHSLFWTHGANDIALPSWWNAFLQQSDPRQCRSNDTLFISSQTLRSSFLDFLYPPKALEYASQVATRASRRHSTTRQRSIGSNGRQGRKKGLSRWYTTNGAKVDQQSPRLASDFAREDLKYAKIMPQKEDIDALGAKADALLEQIELLEIEPKHKDQDSEARWKATSNSKDLSGSSVKSQILHTSQTLARDGSSKPSEHETVGAAPTIPKSRETSPRKTSASLMSETFDNADPSAIDNVINEAVTILGPAASNTYLDREAKLRFWRNQSAELAEAYDTWLKSLDISSTLPQIEDDFLSAFNFEAPIITWQLQSTLRAGLAFLTLFIRHLYSKVLAADEALWTDRQWSFLVRTTILYPKQDIAQSQPLVSTDITLPASMQGVFYLLDRAFIVNHGLEPARDMLRMALQRGQIHFVNALFQFCDKRGLTPSELLAGLGVVDTPSLVQHILDCVRKIKNPPLIENREDLYLLFKTNHRAYLDVIHQLYLQLLRRPLPSKVIAAAYEQIWTLLSDNKRLTIEENIQLLDQLISIESSDGADISAFVHFAYKVFAIAKQQPGFAWSELHVKRFLQKMIVVHHPHCLALFDYCRSKFGYDSEIHKSMLPELSHSGEAEIWQEIFKNLQSRERLGKSDWIHQLLGAYSRRADTATCRILLELSRKEVGHNLDIRSWNAVLHSYIQGGDMAGALNFRKYLEQEGVVPDETTLMILLRGFAARGESNLASEQVKQIQSRGQELTMEMVECLIHSHILEDDLDRAEQLLYNSTRTNVSGPKTEAWNRMLGAFAKQGRLADMNYLRIAMNEHSVQADASTYGALMLGFCMADLPYQASRILSTIMPMNNMVPTIQHYNILIDGFVRKGMFDDAILIYQKAKDKHMRPDAMTRNLIIQATSSIYGDMKKGDSGWSQVRQHALANAVEFLNKSLTEDGYHHAVSPSGKMGFAGTPPNQAYASLHFAFLIHQYAHLGDRAQMDNLLEQYRLFYNKEYPNQELVEPPRILAAIGQYYLKTNDAGGIKQLWDKALQSIKPLATVTGADTNQPGWVLWSRSLMIAPVFRVRMIDLMRRKQHQELEELVKSLVVAGWRFPESIWNLYVLFLAKEGHYRLALEYCEKYLIGGFPGWPTRIANSSQNPKKVIEKHKTGSLNTGVMKPTYEVLCWLAKNYIDFLQNTAFSPQRNQLDQELWKIAPRTLRAVRTMPRVSDKTQNKILRGE